MAPLGVREGLPPHCASRHSFKQKRSGTGILQALMAATHCFAVRVRAKQRQAHTVMTVVCRSHYNGTLTTLLLWNLRHISLLNDCYFIRLFMVLPCSRCYGTPSVQKLDWCLATISVSERIKVVHSQNRFTGVSLEAIDIEPFASRINRFTRARMLTNLLHRRRGHSQRFCFKK